MEACVSAASPSKRKGRRELQSARKRSRLCVTSTRPSLRALCLCFPVRQVGETASAPSSRMRGVDEAQAALGAAPGAQRAGRMAAAVTVGSSVAAPFCRGHTGTERSRAQWATGTGTSQSCRETFWLQTAQAAIPDKHLGWVRRALDRDGQVAPAFGAYKLRRASSSSELLVL